MFLQFKHQVTTIKTMESQEEARQRLIAQARQMQIRMMFQRQQAISAAAGQQRPTQNQMQMQLQSRTMGSAYDDIPIQHPDDFDFTSQQPPTQLSTFHVACRDGPLSTIQSIISTKPQTPASLHLGLVLALGKGTIDSARFLLNNGAPIARKTPEHVLSAPPAMQIPLFELLCQHGWTPNTPGFYGAVLLPRVVMNLELLKWFIENGANPNLGAQRDNRDRMGEPDTDSCLALEAAAIRGSVEAVRILLDAGAKIENGTPLHFAAGACPPGANPHAGLVTPSKEFDLQMIPIMEALVKAGADVNHKTQSRHMNPQYAVVHAVMAGAVERVKWLLQHGADPNARGAFGSAVEYARLGSEEMRMAIEEGIQKQQTLGKNAFK